MFRWNFLIYRRHDAARPRSTRRVIQLQEAPLNILRGPVAVWCIERAREREREEENEKEPLFLRGAVAETWPTRISRLFPVRVAAPIDSTLSISRIPSLRSCLLNYTAVLTFIAPASSSIYITSSNRVFLRKPRLSRSAGQYHYVRCK